MNADPQAAEYIEAFKSALAADLTERHFRRRPELELRYGENGRRRCREDAEFHLRYLAQAMALGTPALFGDYLRWAAAMLVSRGIPLEDLRADMAELESLLAERLPHGARALRELFAAAMRSIGEGGAPVPALSPAAQRYFEAALADPVQAGHVVDALLASGMPVARIYVEVLQPAMYEIGRRWQENTLSSADEHYFTAVTQRVLARLFSSVTAGGARGPLVVVSCVERELHELGARMVCDLLALNGYRTHYLGASLPAAAVVDYACAHAARALALSASITPHLGQIRQAIARVRADARCTGLKVVVGGGAFNGAAGLWRAVGADGWAPDAETALAEVRRLLS